PKRIGASTLPHLTLKIDQQRGVVAETTARAPHRPAPVVPDVPEPGPELIVHEGLIEPKSVAAVGRVPGVGARRPAKQAKRVEPSRLLEPRQPGVFSRPEHPRLLVEPRAAGVGVAEQHRGPAPPAAEQRED